MSATLNPKAHCENCIFGVPGQRDAGNLMGAPAYQEGIICHRMPGPFPMLRPEDWCGEFQLRQ